MKIETVETCEKCKANQGTWGRVTKGFGNPQADILFLCSAPSEQECSTDKFFQNREAQMFTFNLNRLINFNFVQRAYAVPLTFCHTRLAMSCVTSCSSHVNKYIHKNTSLVCMLGGNVYKAFFKQGSIPEMLYGETWLDDKYPWTFFFFSDIAKLPTDGYENYWSDKFSKEIRLFGKTLVKLRRNRHAPVG